MLPCSPHRHWLHSGSLKTCPDTQNRACRCEEVEAEMGGWWTGRPSWSWSSGCPLLQMHTYVAQMKTSKHKRENQSHSIKGKIIVTSQVIIKGNYFTVSSELVRTFWKIYFDLIIFYQAVTQENTTPPLIHLYCSVWRNLSGCKSLSALLNINPRNQETKWSSVQRKWVSVSITEQLDCVFSFYLEMFFVFTCANIFSHLLQQKCNLYFIPAQTTVPLFRRDLL